MKLEELLELGKEPPEKVEVDGVGAVYLQTPTAGDFERIQSQHALLQDAKAGTPATELVCETIAAVMVDKSGKRTVEKGKESQLAEMNPDVFASLYGAALKKIFPDLFNADKVGDSTQEKKESS